MNAPIQRSLRFAMVLAACATSTLASAGSEHAKGTLSLQGEDKPLGMEPKHAYYVVGPDTFEAGRTTRRLVFSADDLATAIAECKDVRCATTPSGDGLTLELGEGALPGYWAHVRPMQYSGSINAGDLHLAVDTPERLAGTLTIENSGVKATIEFEAALTKTFDR